jgi:hypothetical protein
VVANGTTQAAIPVASEVIIPSARWSMASPCKTVLEPATHLYVTRQCSLDQTLVHLLTKGRCSGTALTENPKKASGTFTLTASNPDQAFDGQPIQAAGNHFWVGGHAATYCPSNVGSICNTFPNDTTLIGNGYMATVVPGGQGIYWQKDGALAFTQAHSSAQWNLSYYGGGVAYEGGGYFGPNGEDLITCPVTPAGSNTTAWQLFARLAGVLFPSSCVGLYVVVHDQNLSAGAWQYT